MCLRVRRFRLNATIGRGNSGSIGWLLAGCSHGWFRWSRCQSRRCSAAISRPSILAARNGVAAAFVFVVRGDVADGFVEAHRVVVVAEPLEFGGEDGRVGDGQEVGMFPFQVSPQGLDPRLVGRCRGAPGVTRPLEARRGEPAVCLVSVSCGAFDRPGDAC